jgi:hypothetical protein
MAGCYGPPGPFHPKRKTTGCRAVHLDVVNLFLPKKVFERPVRIFRSWLPEVAVKPRPLGPGYKATVFAFSVIDFAASQDLGLDEPNVKPVEMRRSKAESVKQEPAEAIPQEPAERRRNPLHLMERRMSTIPAPRRCRPRLWQGFDACKPVVSEQDPAPPATNAREHWRQRASSVANSENRQTGRASFAALCRQLRSESPPFEWES